MTTPTPLPPLISGSELAAYLANPQDKRIAAVTEWVRGRCGWHIAPSVTETLTVDAVDTCVVALPSLHVTDVDEVTESGATVDVEWNTAGLLRHPRRWSGRWRSVEATITHGYPTVPADLFKVIVESVLRLGAPGDQIMKKVGPFEVSESTFTYDELATIDRYRILIGP